MNFNYDKSIDDKWRALWEQRQTYKFDKNSSKPKYYLLEMFSYPSGSKLHLGHWWNYSLPDSFGRMKRMQGYNVFQPVGFDAFGLPAENYAIKTGIHPKDSTAQNIKTMEEQLRQLGATYDWDYEVKTNEEEYYKWTQWVFLKLYEKGLAYRKDAPVNYCPHCQTVLANEQASGGECERCHSKVEHKHLTQWFFKITDYAERLLEGLKTIDWPEKTKRIQTNWIGKNTGAKVRFNISGHDEKIEVFTTRVDTLMGVTYVVLAPENSLVDKITTQEQKDAVSSYREKVLHLSEIDRTSTVREKTGVFTGAYAIHPLTGEKVPVYISDYVLESYGTGAVMAVPAHDERDYEFAKKFNLEIKMVINSKDKEVTLPFTESGILVNSGEFNGLSSSDAKKAIVKKLESIGMGEMTTTYRLRDWLISRQRYWGAPIPVVYCDKCGIVPVPESELPVKLPYNVDFKPTGKSPLYYCDEFVNTTCPKCHKKARRETDTLDTFVCSSWYYLRYLDPHNSKMPFDKKITDKFMPVDKYVGGVEHAAMHLLYARFIYKALKDMGYVSGEEPFKSLIHQGTILGADGQKMSKSLGNTVSADEYVAKFGSDVFRTYLGFGFSYTEGGPWSDDGILAINKFFQKIAKVFENFSNLEKNSNDEIDEDLEVWLHKTIKSVTQDMENFQFNTSIARLMELTTQISKYQAKPKRNYEQEKHAVYCYAKLLAPIMPHYMEDVWQKLGHETSIFDEKWPTFDEAKTMAKSVEIAIQVNGQIRARINILADTSDEDMKKIALENENVTKYTSGKQIKKVICIKNRLVNIVAV